MVNDAFKQGENLFEAGGLLVGTFELVEQFVTVEISGQAALHDLEMVGVVFQRQREGCGCTIEQ